MAKPKVKRLKIADALDRLDEMIPLIVRDVESAIQTEAALETANELVTGDELRGAKFYGADCYNAVNLSMAIFLALTLAKLFETPSLRGLSKSTRFNLSDVASIPLMIRLLKQARCRKRLCNRARNWTPMMSTMAETHAKSCGRAIDGAIDAYAKLRRTHASRNAIAKLKLFRDKLVAHTLLGVALNSRPIYRELFLLVDVARDVTEQARLAISGIHIDLRESEEEHVNIARAFWHPALIASAKAGRVDRD
jgi:hypothetical protein